MLLKIIEKIIRENVFERKKKKPGLNLTLGEALIGLRTSGPMIVKHANLVLTFKVIRWIAYQERNSQAGVSSVI